MTSVIKSWSGRTGNNIIQLINCIHYSFYIHKYNKIIFPKHILFKTNNIVSGEEVKEIKKKFADPNNFFYAKKLGFTISPKQMREISQKYIVPIVNLKLSKETEEVMIHLRGGDMMKSHPFFIQPPWKYYQLIIDSDNFTKINVVHEDQNNFCLNKFKELNNTTTQSKDIISDIERLCQGKKLVMSFSTFSLMIFFLSKNLEEIYLPKYMIEEWYPNLGWGMKTNIIELKNYNLNLWKNKNLEERNKFLIEYSGDVNFS